MEIEKIVEELKSIITFKNTTEVGDIVIIVTDEPQMVVYAFVSSIKRDISKKDEWWHLTFNFLSLPPQEMKWTLRTPQFTGQEFFTMGGDKRFIQAVEFFKEEKKPVNESSKSSAAVKGKIKPLLRVVK
jgi:hypothetical protein